MPDINSRGNVLTGRGLAYLNDDTIIEQREYADGWKVSRRAWPDGAWEPISERGCHMIAARDGHWLAFLAGYGVFGAHIPRWDKAALAGDIQSGRGVSAPDGTIAVVTDYKTGVGLSLVHPDGSVVGVPDAYPAASVCVVNRTRALWQDWQTQRVETCGGLSRPHVILGPCGWPHVLWLNGERWMAYHSTDALGAVLHPFNDATMGYRVAPVPAFYLAARKLGPSTVKLAWGHNAADTDVGERIIDVATEPRVRLVPPSPPPPGPPETPPMPETHLDTVIRERAKYGTPLGLENAWRVSNAVAWTHRAEGWGLHRKGGTNWLGYAVDIVAKTDGTMIDILGDSEGEGRPAWNPTSGVVDWAPPLGGNEPPPEPPAPPSDLDARVARIEVALRRVGDLFQGF